MSYQPDRLVAALNEISSRCDYADAKDGVGFNATDTYFGKALATMPVEDWSESMVVDAYKMLAKYRKQLAQYGVDYDAIPAPPDFEHRDGDGRAYAKETMAREYEAELLKEQRQIKTHPSERHVSVQFPYDPELVDAIKAAVPSDHREWNGDSKQWLVTAEAAPALNKVLEEFEFTISAGAEQLIAAEQNEMTQPVVESAQATLDGDKIVVVTAEFPGWDAVNAMKEVKGRKWNGEANVFPLTAADELIELAASEVFEHGLELSADVQALVGESDREAERLGKARELAEAVDSSNAVVIDRLQGTLRPFQKVAVQYVREQKRTLIADEMGCGKTVEAIAAVEDHQAYPAVIVVPKIAKNVWKEHLETWVPHRSVQVAHGLTAEPITADVLIVNYDILEAWMPTEAQAVVLDESHYVKNAKAQRTKACAALAALVPDDGLVLLLTGTPVVNRPAELISQLQILGQMDRIGSWYEYVTRYCAGKRTRFGWDVSGASNLKELNEKLKSTCMIRRRKEQVLKDLPPKTWAKVGLNDFAQAERRKYQEAEQNLIGFVGRMAAEIAEATGDDPDSARVLAQMKARAAEHLVQFNVLSKLAVDMKMKAVGEWIDNVLDTGEKLIVFAHHRDVVDQLAERYSAPKIQGGMSEQARVDAEFKFMNDPDCKVIVCSISAANVALTLTAASNVVFVEQGWAPAHEDQAADRAHRIGQTKAVTAYKLIATDTIEEDIFEIVERKRPIVSGATDGSVDEQEASVLGELIERIAARAAA
jgi:hypothetical protein